jgi:tetratricopeptide (TPR) repeat protein
MRFPTAALSLLVLAGLGGCASSDSVTLRGRQAELDRPGRLYALYLGGQTALSAGRSAEAAALFGSVADAEPQDTRLRERAFVAALLAGDVARAARLAPPADATNAGNQRLGRLVRAVEHLAAGQGAASAAELGGEMVGYPHRSAATLLRPWAMAAAGDLAGATAPVPPTRDRMLHVFARRDRALLLERARRFEEAEAEWKPLREQMTGNAVIALGFGGFLERRGRRDEAVAVYRAELKNDPDNGDLATALARATARRSAAPPLETIPEGAAGALLAPAANLIAERQNELGLAYLRLALRLDPTLNQAWLLVGDQLGADKDREAVRAAYGRVRPGSPEHAEAQARLAFTYQDEGRIDEALRLIEVAAKARPSDRTIQVAYADLLRAAERWNESAAVVTSVIDREGGVSDWRLLYMRGIALDRAGRWPEAERDLVKAHEANPDEPELLNYLGYAWVDRGENLQRALGMIQKAVSLRPRSGAIIDSLGWAQYRLGRYDEAVKQLERAVELEPADPTINDHLGDAYWRTGRPIEAQFQWRRVLTLNPEAKLKAQAERKLESGLEGAAPVRAAAAAKP